jgi:hypothetical protein
VPSIQATAAADVRYGNATRNTIAGLGQGRPQLGHARVTKSLPT